MFPETGTRKFERIEIKQEANGLRLIVHDSYKNFHGSTSWLIDENGRGVVSCDYTYTGPAMDTREAGIRFLLKPDCDEAQMASLVRMGRVPERKHQSH